MGKVWKRSAPATTDNQGFMSIKMSVDPLKLEPPFQLPHPDWPIQSKKRKTHRKSKTNKEDTKKPLMDARAALLAIFLAKKDSSQKEEKKENPQNEEGADIVIFSRHKKDINRVLGTEKTHDSSYIELLEQAVSQDAIIQRVLSKVTDAATDIKISDEERTEAAKAIIAFTILLRDRYNVARSSCDDKSDKQSEALMDLIYFYEKMDESISQLACEVYSQLAEIDRLERKIEQKKEEMRKLLKKEKNIAAATAIGSLVAAPVIELFIAPGLVGKIYPFYLAFLGIVALGRLRILSKKSLANLDDQKFFEAEQEEKKRELDCLALPEPA